MDIKTINIEEYKDSKYRTHVRARMIIKKLAKLNKLEVLSKAKLKAMPWGGVDLVEMVDCEVMPENEKEIINEALTKSGLTVERFTTKGVVVKI